MKRNSGSNAEKYDFRIPVALREAKIRLNIITTDVLNVEKQLGDRRRVKTMSEADYDSWREKTKAARIFMVAEMRFLKTWILDRRRRLLAQDSGVWPEMDPRTMLRRVVIEGRRYIRGEANTLTEVLDAVDLFLTHDA